ncbi:MAG: hypothetical protein GOVbin5978_31 [Prokaryotic dsDNA virus sp.]|nr:MAG: hypothetical protein GOVbin5978_31 [Prokaryotic dsDNA virus sp.]|tara:strand:+ start:35475 stop:35900 length:426 start_codon:yes stop_codon:yes gene_type:complete
MEDITKIHNTKLDRADALFEIIEDVTGVTKKQLLSKSRLAHIAIARNIAGYILHKEVKITSIETAKILNLNHSTVIYYAKMFDDNYHYYEEFRANYVLVSGIFWSKFTNTEKDVIDLQLKSISNLMKKLKKRTNYLLTINN